MLLAANLHILMKTGAIDEFTSVNSLTISHFIINPTTYILDIGPRKSY